jgi:hypothetical protein
MTSPIDSHTPGQQQPWMIVTVSRVSTYSITRQSEPNPPPRIRSSEGSPAMIQVAYHAFAPKWAMIRLRSPRDLGDGDRELDVSLNKECCCCLRRDSDLLGLSESGEPLDPSSRHTWTVRSEPPLSKRCWHSCCEGGRSRWWSNLLLVSY